MQRAILTGATGAVGSALIEELTAHDIEVLVLVNPESKRRDVIPRHPLVRVMPCALSELSALQNETGLEYDVFYHFAWAGTTGAARDDMFLQNQNVRHTLDAVEAAKRFGCRRFIGAGSQAEYGPANCILTPDTPTFPLTGYGMAKLCAGQMSRSHAHQRGMEHIWVRILSVYGPNDGAQSMVMNAIRCFAAGHSPRCTPGEQMWDYLYSGDAAKAFRLLGEKGIDGKTYVLGSGEARPLAAYLREIRDVVNPNCDLKLGEMPYPPGQVMHLQADISELERDIAWRISMVFSEGIVSILREIQ